ncbi:hypothetical protein B0T11DRAFT_274685 [Plectosphaerella cucumerina]|uniref:Integral membrane protein n=1 Tax=Plectosphaerella cucumerina TaxID=40658 RepID=A0A8K0TK76_9PEZI|nr:hypothetical protein B0T11DRAFT_274685 [Plectosphaerella cucumerina]
MHHNATPPRPTAVSDEVSPARSQQSVTTPPAKAPITAETACINIPLSAPATWYSHRDAPDIYICTRCYDGHLRDTQFRHEFNSTYLDDHQPRACRFSTPRIQKHLLATAAQTGSLGELIAHMKSRAVIPNCKGIGGASAAEGIKWFIAKDNAIPGMVICEACWEDFVVVSPFASRFQRPDYQQDEKVVWACDMAVPFIRKELDRRAEVSDWTGFAAEAGGRLSIPPCGKAERVPRRSRKWLCPKDMPAVVACPACFCDHVVGSGEEDRWREWEEVPGLEFADNFICALGQFTIGLAMSFAEDRNDYSLFWRALVKAAEGPECNPEGTKGATWYTLRDSDPRDFFVCGLCHAAIVEPMGMGGFFTAKPGVPPDAAPRCCLNPRFPRFMSYLQKLLDGYFAQSTAALSAFASDYASLPLCRRDTLLQDAAWYGWPECTICPECHHEFIRGTALADAMPYQGGRWETSTMCKMYSPRMRALYLEACRANPPDATEMLAYSEHRTGVYVRTVMVVKQILQQQRMAIYQQQRLNGQSLFYTSLGNTQANLLGSDGRTYGAAGVGYGFQNEFQLDGARYGKQAMEVGASVRSGSAAIQIEELERQWKMVE